jgi:hypothetical protein
MKPEYYKVLPEAILNYSGFIGYRIHDRMEPDETGKLVHAVVLRFSDGHVARIHRKYLREASLKEINEHLTAQVLDA